MAETQSMDENRVKRIVELMLKNSAPMPCMLFFRGFIQKGGISTIEAYQAITKETLCVRDIYAEIDVRDLDDLTGRTIIETNKPLVAEHYSVLMPIWETFRDSGFKPQPVPKRIIDICNIVNQSIDSYQTLLGCHIYDESVRRGYLEHLTPGTHIGWFILGKPVTYHPEKLSQLIEFAQKLARAKS